MARLFVSPRDYQFITDVTKELMRDVVGSKVYLYCVDTAATTESSVYGDAREKIYCDPVEVDALVKRETIEVKSGKFGREQYNELRVHFHYADLLDSNLTPREGDIVSWGDFFYEINELKEDVELWGNIEFIIGLECTARQVQSGTIQTPVIPPVGRKAQDTDGMATPWEQSRGKKTNSKGRQTRDRRNMIVKDQMSEPEVGIQQSTKGEPLETRRQASFYDNLNSEDD